MARKIKTSAALPVALMTNEAALDGAMIDHSSQRSSWTPPSVAELPDLDDVEAAVQLLEASEVSEDEASDETVATTSTVSIFDSFTEQQVEETVFAIATQLDRRAEQEAKDHPDNASIQSTLKKARSAMVTKRAAKVMLAANIDPAVFNRSVHSGSFYNVYAIGKLADFMAALTGGVLKNAINNACLRSLFQVNKAGLVFDLDTAKACASNKVPVKAEGVRKHLVRHTVSESTAPTQASSTMQALVTLNVVKVTGSARNPSYELLENGVTEKLRALIAA